MLLRPWRQAVKVPFCRCRKSLLRQVQRVASSKIPALVLAAAQAALVYTRHTHHSQSIGQGTMDGYKEFEGGALQGGTSFTFSKLASFDCSFDNCRRTICVMRACICFSSVCASDRALSAAAACISIGRASPWCGSVAVRVTGRNAHHINRKVHSEPFKPNRVRRVHHPHNTSFQTIHLHGQSRYTPRP